MHEQRLEEECYSKSRRSKPKIRIKVYLNRTNQLVWPNLFLWKRTTFDLNTKEPSFTFLHAVLFKPSGLIAFI